MPTKTTRPSTRNAPRFNRTATPASVGGWKTRRQPKRSTMQKTVAAVTRALPGLGRSSKPAKRRGRGSKAGGFALMSAAGGLAYKNRGKLMSMLGRKGERDNATAETAPVEAGTRPTSGSVDPIRSGNLAPTDPGNRPDMR